MIEKYFLKKFIGGIVNNKGFTVIEYLLIIFIIFILLGINRPYLESVYDKVVANNEVITESEMIQLQKKADILEEQIFILEKKIEDYQKKN